MRPRPLRLLLVPLAAVACARAGGGTGAAVASAAPRADIALSAESIVGADSVLVRLTTTRGDVDLVVRRHWAPAGAARVGEAVAAGYYDGARFFRALRGFVVQFGIAADTAMSAAWRARAIPDDPVTQSNRRGSLVFAAGGPNTRTVQLFINLRDNARLDALGFAPVGEVVAGMDAVDALYTAYGEGPPSGSGPNQRDIGQQGEAYLAREFPLLDRIVRARVVRAWPAPASDASR
ncbi:MAG: peptidylprolyl isomerase [Gemmatimonadota bacterium]|nr:peptidylprolyl isomerase [Gemmatimonadota bacterium]